MSVEKSAPQVAAEKLIAKHGDSTFGKALTDIAPKSTQEMIRDAKTVQDKAELSMIFGQKLAEAGEVPSYLHYGKPFGSLNPAEYPMTPGEAFIKEVNTTGSLPPTSKTPPRYASGKDYDLIDVIHDYKLNFNRGNVVKYVMRAGKKDSEILDLEKALDYLQRELEILKKEV